MLKITHSCGYTKEFNFPCPKCGQPFCEEDQVQAWGGALVGHINNHNQIKALIKRLEELEKRVYSCKNYKDEEDGV